MAQKCDRKWYGRDAVPIGNWRFFCSNTTVKSRFPHCDHEIARLAAVQQIQKTGPLKPPVVCLSADTFSPASTDDLLQQIKGRFSVQNWNESIFRNERDICAKKTCLHTKRVVKLRTFGKRERFLPPSD